jgi:predicted TPR repeat methyltransferase
LLIFSCAQGYFRRGQAYLKTRDADNAERDVRKASQLAPSDVAIRKQLQKVAAEKKRQNQKQVRFFYVFFGSFAEMLFCFRQRLSR